MVANDDKELRELVALLVNPVGENQERWAMEQIESFVAKRVDDAKPKEGYYIHQHEVNKDQKRKIIALTEENTKLKAELTKNEDAINHLVDLRDVILEERHELKARLEAAMSFINNPDVNNRIQEVFTQEAIDKFNQLKA